MIILGVLGLIAVILLIIIYITLVKQRYRVEDNEISLADSRLSLISEGFEITKEVTSAVRGYSFRIDSIHKKWNIELTEPSIQKTYSFSDYLKYDLIKDGKSLVEGKAGSAIVGGMLFGGIGALAGAAGSRQIHNICSNMSLIIYVNDINNPCYQLKLIECNIQTDSKIYKEIADEATEIIAMLEYMHAQNQRDSETQSVHASSTDSITEIERLHDLMERGIITAEEFEAKKKQLLNI